jgi:hypothetical protein
MLRTQSPITTLFGGVREKLSAARTYYVRTDGSDSNTGRENTAAGAFLTLTKAASVAYDGLDLNGFDVTVRVADGTYTAGILRQSGQVGEGRIGFIGNEATPASCIISVTGANNCVQMYNSSTIYVSGFKVVSSARGLYTAWGGMIYFNHVDFGACTSYQIRASAGWIWCVDWSSSGSLAYTISGAAPAHLSAHVGGTIYIADAAVTVSGTPAFSTAFALISSGGSLEATGTVFTGSATGLRFLAEAGGSVSPAGYTFPGNATGSVAAGGIGPDGRINGNAYYSLLFQASITDDAATSVQLDGVTAGIALIDINTVGGAKTAVPRGQFGARAGAAGAFAENISLDLTAVTLTTGILAGTTGVDGIFTIAPHTDGKLYFENRTGSTRQISLRVLS